MGLIQKLWTVCIIVLCCSCGGQPTTIPLPTQSTVTVTAEADQPQLLAQPLSFTGDSYFTSDPFDLGNSGKVEISWDYSGKGPFAFWILSSAEFNSDPQYDRILIKNVDDKQATGQSTIDLIAGSYVIEVEVADGPWQIKVAAKP